MCDPNNRWIRNLPKLIMVSIKYGEEIHNDMDSKSKLNTSNKFRSIHTAFQDRIEVTMKQ